MIELIALVENHQVWIHSASLLFSLVYAAEELFFCINLCTISDCLWKY